MATSVIIDNQTTKTGKIYDLDYPLIEFKPTYRVSTVTEILPFRVKFTAVQIESISSNVPAIPFQIIGYSNYIL